MPPNIPSPGRALAALMLCLLLPTAASAAETKKVPPAQAAGTPAKTIPGVAFVADGKLTELPPAATQDAAFDPDLLLPVEGVGLRRYAHIAYEMAVANYTPGQQPDAVPKRYGISAERFQKVGEGWAERFQADASMTLNRLYTGWFSENATGKVAALGKDLANSYLNQVPLRETPPMDQEAYFAAMSTIARKAQFSQNPLEMNNLTSPYGYTYPEWLVVSNWMGRLVSQDYDLRDR